MDSQLSYIPRYPAPVLARRPVLLTRTGQAARELTRGTSPSPARSVPWSRRSFGGEIPGTGGHQNDPSYFRQHVWLPLGGVTYPWWLYTGSGHTLDPPLFGNPLGLARDACLRQRGEQKRWLA